MRGRRQRQQAVSLFAFQDIITSVTGVLVLVMLLLALALTNVSRTPIETQLQVNRKSDLQMLVEERDQLQARVQDSLETTRDLSTSPSNMPQSRESLLKAIESLEQETIALKVEGASKAAQLEGGDLEAHEEELDSLVAKIREVNAVLEQNPAVRQITYTKNRLATKSGWLVDLNSDEIQVGQPGDIQAFQRFPVEKEGQVPKSFVNWARVRNRTTEYFVLLVRPKSVLLYVDARVTLEEMEFDIGFDLLGAETLVFEEE